MAGVTAATLLLAGCGGGGGGGSTSLADSSNPSAPPSGGTATPPPATPTPGASLARGTVTGFGSVYLNGKRYVTEDAQFIIDGKPGTQDDLAIGMIANIAGELQDGVATVVRFDEDIEGPVDAIDGDTLTVFGQTVRLVPDTRFDDGLQLADLQVGDVLEISGLRDADDALIASYIEREDDLDEFEVTGRVRNLDTVMQTFTLGGLTVDFSIAELDDLESGLANGVLVEVTDEQRVYTPGAFSVLASEVEGRSLTVIIDDDDELADDFFDDDADDPNDDDYYEVGEGSEFELEGLITELIAADRFVINGIEVLITDETEFEYGDESALVVGARIEVDGELNGAGQLVAEEIELADNEGRVAGLVEVVNPDAGELQVFGVQIRITEDTDVEDERDEFADSDDDREDLSTLLIGDYVEVEGVVVGDILYATEIEIDDEADDTSLRGPVSAADAASGTLAILGVDLTTDSATEYETDDDEPESREAFFAAIAEGQSWVEAEWDGLVTDPAVPVAELELED